MACGGVVELPEVLREVEHPEDAVDQDVEELHDVAVAGNLLALESGMIKFILAREREKKRKYLHKGKMLSKKFIENG